ncbi:MAG: MmcQ/YjbR family DNA-binding protein [Blautia sp.]|nr:MmcQ/YjbR family DNA-binding protein [Blautia sp.]
MKEGEMRQRLLSFVSDTYQAKEEHLWQRTPETLVFRHQDNQKWFALFMTVRGSLFGYPEGEFVDILDLRCPDFLLRDALLSKEGYFPAYHMHKGNWITVLLDGSVSFEEIGERIEESFFATASKEVRGKKRGPKEWLIPANPQYYDVQEAFRRERIIDWKQGRGILEGDIVFMYLAAPVSAILYACRVVKTQIPYEMKGEKVQISALMEIELLHTFQEDRFTLSVLRESYGVRYIRGPRGVPAALSQALSVEIGMDLEGKV